MLSDQISASKTLIMFKNLISSKIASGNAFKSCAPIKYIANITFYDDNPIIMKRSVFTMSVSLLVRKPLHTLQKAFASPSENTIRKKIKATAKLFSLRRELKKVDTSIFLHISFTSFGLLIESLVTKIKTNDTR